MNRDLYLAYQARGLDIDECNADKSTLREWRARELAKGSDKRP